MWGSDVSAQVVPLAQRAERGYMRWSCGAGAAAAPALSPEGERGRGRAASCALKMAPGDGERCGAELGRCAAQPLLGGWGLKVSPAGPMKWKEDDLKDEN